MPEENVPYVVFAVFGVLAVAGSIWWLKFRQPDSFMPPGDDPAPDAEGEKKHRE